MTPKQKKVLKIAENYQKSPEIAKNGQKPPLSVYNFVLDWYIDLNFLKFYSWSDPHTEEGIEKLPTITENCQKQPKTTSIGI